MADQKSSIGQRLSQIKDLISMEKRATTIPWDPNCTQFPSRKELPKIGGTPDGAAWFWGKDDNLGRLNLLTPTRVLAASKLIATGEVVPVNLPLNVPSQPGFNREVFQHEIKTLADGIAHDDLYHLNTQSGTQWDGFRHVAHIESKTFYNNTKASDITGPDANLKCSIHYWAQHGIAGRGILLDWASYAEKKGIQYNVYDTHQVSYDDLYECGKMQGLDIRPQSQGGDIKVGDLMFIRFGWVAGYKATPPEERKRLALREHEFGPEDGQRYIGLKQEEKMLDWLHDCYFAAIGGDAPSLEAWPSQTDFYLHEYILALWGMPLGEMLDLCKLARKCEERNRWTFFFTSSPANCEGGVGSHVNGMAIF